MSALVSDSANRAGSLAERARRVALVAAEHAGDVDTNARFPHETLAALRESGLLAAAVPSNLGGEGAAVSELGEVAMILAEACASSAMIFAMHQIQVACVIRHRGDSHAARGALESLVNDGTLFASATTEINIGGDTRKSGCAVEVHDGDRVTLAKTAPVISYGAHADFVLATARRTADAAPSDQVLVICPAANMTLRQISQWDTLGFRGTCSPGFELQAEVTVDHVLPVEYATISAETMLPISHVLWASVWLGIAHAAADRATRAVQSAARKTIGTLPPAATRLAELLGAMSAFDSVVADATRSFDSRRDDSRSLTSIGSAIAFNALKITASDAVIDIVSKAMLVAGIAGYRQDSELSLGRLLRDAYGTAVMVNNDRILANNAQLSLMQRKHTSE